MTKQTHNLVMPAFGADMATGTLIEWQVKAGDSVKRGDVVAVIETNKGAIELDVFEDTAIDSLLAEVGDEVRVGTVIARLVGPGPEAPTDPEVTQEEPPSQVESVTAPVTTAPASTAKSSAEGSFVLASPAARHQAKVNGLDLAEIANTHSGPITLSDLPFDDSAKITSEQKPASTTPTSSAKQMMREAISDTVSLSKRTIPHYYLTHRLDITALKAYLSEFNQDKEPQGRVLLAAPMLCAIARLLSEHSQLNGVYSSGRYTASSSVHLSHAVNVRGTGLIMPVIRDADQLDALQIMQVITKQVTEARRGRLPMSQLSGGTCCVSSIGERGAEQLLPVILPPQVAIIALGSPHQEPLVIDGEVTVRDVILSSLAADHRVSDGHIGAKFLYQLNKLIQQPERLWTESN